MHFPEMEPRMNKVAIFVELQAKPEMFEAFRAAMLKHAAISLKEDPGCRQFDLFMPREPAHTVMIYEVYDDEASFQGHAKSKHTADHQAATKEMVASRRLVKAEIINR
jgi:(4S)-4-hydroxy-5-phosphonooxypentane-2,3-dione isomerase